MSVTPAPRGRNPYSTEGVTRGEDGIARYAQRPSSLVHMLQATVDRGPDATALVEVGGEALTWGELWQRAVRVAGGLREAGVNRGDRVTIRLPNGADWVLAFWGTQIAGAVAVPVNTRFKTSEVDYVRTDSGAVYGFEPDAALPDGEPLITADLRPGELAAIFYTSGTTGFPKGAMMSHANFLANVESAIRCVGLDRDEGASLATLINVPLFHVTGCNAQLLVMTELGGRTFVLANPLDLDGLPDHGQPGGHPDAHLGAGDLPRAHPPSDASRRPTSSHVRWVSYGGAPIAADSRPRDHARVSRTRASATASGSPRPSSLTSFLPHEEALEHADSVGFAMPVTDLAIDQPDPETGVGELLVRGENVVLGLLEQARGDRRDVRRRVAAHR